MGASSEYKSPGACIRRGDLTVGFLYHEFEGLYLERLIHRGAYFRIFAILILSLTGPIL